jgi:hypothetical protein
MSEPINGQTQNKRLIPQGDQQRYTGEILLRTRPKIYQAIARELAEPNASVNGISRRYRVAELGASRMEERIGAASLRDAAIGTGIAVDKMLALTGQLPTIQIANLVMPTEEERAERRAIEAKLDEITRRLWEQSERPESGAGVVYRG